MGLEPEILRSLGLFLSVPVSHRLLVDCYFLLSSFLHKVKVGFLVNPGSHLHNFATKQTEDHHSELPGEDFDRASLGYGHLRQSPTVTGLGASCDRSCAVLIEKAYICMLINMIFQQVAVKQVIPPKSVYYDNFLI